MPFLDFLKKKKRPEYIDEFDVPPAPPSLEDIEKELPPFEPEKPFEPEIPEPRIGPLPEIKPMPEIMPIEKPEEKPKPLFKPLFKPKKEAISAKFEEEAVKEEKEFLERKTVMQPLFIRLDHFKSIIKEINNARSDLKKSEDAITLLLDVKSNKEKEFEKWRKILDDIQKKLIFIDKTLFKG